MQPWEDKLMRFAEHYAQEGRMKINLINFGGNAGIFEIYLPKGFPMSLNTISNREDRWKSLLDACKGDVSCDTSYAIKVIPQKNKGTEAYEEQIKKEIQETIKYMNLKLGNVYYCDLRTKYENENYYILLFRKMDGNIWNLVDNFTTNGVSAICAHLALYKVIELILHENNGKTINTDSTPSNFLYDIKENPSNIDKYWFKTGKVCKNKGVFTYPDRRAYGKYYDSCKYTNSDVDIVSMTDFDTFYFHEVKDRYTAMCYNTLAFLSSILLPTYRDKDSALIERIACIMPVPCILFLNAFFHKSNDFLASRFVKTKTLDPESGKYVFLKRVWWGGLIHYASLDSVRNLTQAQKDHDEHVLEKSIELYLTQGREMIKYMFKDKIQYISHVNRQHYETQLKRFDSIFFKLDTAFASVFQRNSNQKGLLHYLPPNVESLTKIHRPLSSLQQNAYPTKSTLRSAPSTNKLRSGYFKSIYFQK